jgi:phage gpG-like protein
MTQQVFTVDDIAGLEDVLGQVFDEIAIGYQEADYTAPLAHSLLTLQDQHQVMYDSGQDSNGSAWEPLAPSTVARKGHDTILVDTNRMKASLVSPTGDSIRDVVSENGMAGAVFGTDVEYARFHVAGTSRMPARPPVGISEKTIDQVQNEVADHTVASMMG